MDIWCVCLEEEDDKDDQGKIRKDAQGKEMKVYKCQAVVGTSPWKIKDILDKLCKNEAFEHCVRLKKFIEYTKAKAS